MQSIELISKLENLAPTRFVVIPAQAGIQRSKGFLDARLRGHDDEWMLSPILRLVLDRSSATLKLFSVKH